MNMLDRLSSVKRAQKMALQESDRQSTASSILRVELNKEADLTEYDQLFELLLPHVAKHWGYSEDDCKAIQLEGQKKETVIPLVKAWMIDCIIYDFDVSVSLRAKCFLAFQEKSQAQNKYSPPASMLAEYGYGATSSESSSTQNDKSSSAHHLKPRS